MVFKNISYKTHAMFPKSFYNGSNIFMSNCIKIKVKVKVDKIPFLVKHKDWF